MNNRWDGEGLSGPSKVIFDVLDDLVRDITKTLVLGGKIDLTEDFRHLVSYLCCHVKKQNLTLHILIYL